MTTTDPGCALEHELVLYDGPDDLVELMAPFVREGADAEEWVVLIGEPDVVGRLASTAGDATTVRALPERDTDRFPARDLHRFDRMLSGMERAAPRVRAVNQMPTMTPARWPEWRRYEAAVNTVLAGHRLWGTCAYDTRQLTADMLADLAASHPVVRTADGRRASADFADLDERSRDYLHVPPHPVERTHPDLVLPDPTGTQARGAVRRLAIACGLSPTAQESVILATNEAVTNARVHGDGPVLLRAWAGEQGRMTVSVSDAGTGPHPLVGFVPGELDGASGRGMWIVHLLVRDIHHRTTGDGYTITFTVDGDTALPAADGRQRG